MAVIDFPDSPSVEDTYTVGDRTWRWTGAVWESVPTPGPTGPTGPAGPQGDIGPTGPTGADAASTITGGASSIATTNLTASRALVSDGSGKVAVSAVTSTELGYVDGVTSNIQTQLNTKASTGKAIAMAIVFG
jgi:hypothetical protein